jgi:hypothetical protein
VGDSDAHFRIEVSEDLSTWTALGTFPTDGGQLTITDQNPSDFKQRYYRAVQVP